MCCNPTISAVPEHKRSGITWNNNMSRLNFEWVCLFHHISIRHNIACLIWRQSKGKQATDFHNLSYCKTHVVYFLIIEFIIVGRAGRKYNLRPQFHFHSNLRVTCNLHWCVHVMPLVSFGTSVNALKHTVSQIIFFS